MKLFSLFRAASMAALMVMASSWAGALDLVVDGRPAFAGVVIAEKATPPEKRAAEELVHHFQRATGVELPVLSDDAAPPAGRYIHLGGCKANRAAGLDPAAMDNNHGVVLATDAGLHLAGKDDPKDVIAMSASPGVSLAVNNVSAGTLFAVYDFLENDFGARWLWPGPLGEVIPAHRDLSMPAGRRDVAPAVLSSLWRDFIGEVSGWADPENRRAFHAAQAVWLKRHRFACDGGFQLGHAFVDYFDKYGKEHPEYFNLLPDGTRRTSPYGWRNGNPKFISICATNPGLVETVVANWARNPKRTINLNENDAPGECVCDDCLAADNAPEPAADRRERAKIKFDEKDKDWSKELGSVSERYCHFYLAVQQEADKIDPNHKIMGLIYANYSEPPSELVLLNDRITLRFCPPFMYPWTEQKVTDYKRIYDGWTRTGAKMMFRPNFTLCGNYFPVLYQDVFYDLYMHSVPGMVAVDMDSLTGHYAAQGLTNYVIASLNHDRATPLQHRKDDFYAAFGPAQAAMQRYFDYFTDVSMDPERIAEGEKTLEGGSLYLDLYLGADSLFTPEVMAQGWALLDDALAAADGDPTATERITFFRHGLKNIELTMAAQVEFREYKKTKNLSAMAAKVRELDRFRASIENTGALNMGQIYLLEGRHWPWRPNLWLADVPHDTLTDWTFLLDPGKVGEKEAWFKPSFDRAAANPVDGKSAWSSLAAGKEWKEKNNADYTGVAWYFNTLDKIAPRGGKATLLFQTVYGDATVYLNGERIYHRPAQGRYFFREPFRFTIPDGLLKPEGNLLAVRVENNTAAGGIRRAVNIVYGE